LVTRRWEKAKGPFSSGVPTQEGGGGEQEAKAFARATLAEGLNVNAGTLNPHLPKRMINSIQLLDWLKEPEG